MSNLIARRGMMAKQGGKWDGYQFVQWITPGSGGYLRYFTTPIIINQNLCVKTKLVDRLSYNAMGHTIGSQNTTNARFNIWANDRDKNWRFGYGNKSNIDQAKTNFYNTIVGLDTWSIERRGKYIYLNDELIYTCNGTFTYDDTNHLLIFYAGTASGGDIGSSQHLAECQVYEEYGGTLLADYRPAIRLADNKPGILDLLSGEFNTGMGGPFVVGPNI